MEGYLSIDSGLFSGYKAKYFILHGDILSYADKKGSATEVRIHLAVSGIKEQYDDLSIIVLNTGVSEMKLKAPSMTEKCQWEEAIRRSQRDSINQAAEYATISFMRQENQADTLAENARNLNPKIRELLYGRENRIADEKLSNIWILQASLKNKLFTLQSEVSEHSTAYRTCDELDGISDELKHNLTVCAKV